MIEVDEGVSSSRGTARDRAAQAIHYYNNNVLKARTGSRSSAYSYQHQRIRGGAATSSRPDNLYRSNSSLELLHDTNLNECHRNRGENVLTPTLKREYGSHGSIDVIAAAAVVDYKQDDKDAREQFFSMLQDYKPTVSKDEYDFRHVHSRALVGREITKLERFLFTPAMPVITELMAVSCFVVSYVSDTCSLRSYVFLNTGMT